MRNFDRPDPLHPLLAFLLLFQQLSFARDVAAVALCEHILPHRRNRFSGDDLTADRRLQRHHEHLPRDDRLELLDKFAALDLRFAAMCDQGQRIHGLSRDEHVELDQVALAEPDHLVIHGGVALGTRLQLVVEVVNDLAQRDLVLQHDPVARPVLEVLEGAAALLAQLHHRADVRGRHDDGQLHVRL